MILAMLQPTAQEPRQIDLVLAQMVWKFALCLFLVFVAGMLLTIRFKLGGRRNGRY